MHTTKILIVFLCYFLLPTATFENEKKCDKPHQIWQECACRWNCENDTEILTKGHKERIEGNCSASYTSRTNDSCVTGCLCEENYFDDGNGSCVLAENCPLPVQCPQNESYVLYWWKCPPTCRQLGGCGWGPPGERNIQLRARPEYYGCQCKPGYVRNHNNDCILVNDCPQHPPKCSEANQEFQECGSPCPLTCDYVGKPEKCLNICIGGCFCKKGYVLNYNRQCVLPDACPKKLEKFVCGENEDYVFCAPNCDELLTFWDDLIDRADYACNQGCSRTKNCICKAGYIRESEGGKCQLAW